MVQVIRIFEIRTWIDRIGRIGVKEWRQNSIFYKHIEVLCLCGRVAGLQIERIDPDYYTEPCCYALETV